MALNRVLAFCAAWVMASCTAQQATPPAHAAERLDVSLIQLIASPRDYHGKLIRVIGFCRLEFEGSALYLHREDFERGISKNAIWLSLGWPVPEPRRRMSDEYVLVEGTFDAEGQGHMGMFSGELHSISRMERWAPRTEFERDQRPSPPSR